MPKHYSIIVFFVLTLPLFLACRPEPQQPKDKVTLQLKWVHQAQFAGFYMAQEKGYYQDENLEVSFVEGGATINQGEQLEAGKADFAVVPAEMLLLQNKPVPPLVAVSVLYQRNPTVFVAKKDSGIIRPRDFVGKTIAVGNLEQGGFLEGIIQLTALLQSRGIDPATIYTVPYEPQYQGFIAGNVDITPAYLVGGVVRLRNQGLAINTIWPGDYGIDFYSDTLAATRSFLMDKPGVTLRFLRASLKGWQDCINNQEEAVQVVLRYAKIQEAALQRDMLTAIVPLVHTGKDPVGWMNEETWKKMESILREQGLLEDARQEINTVYTMHFLEQIYP